MAACSFAPATPCRIARSPLFRRPFLCTSTARRHLTMSISPHRGARDRVWVPVAAIHNALLRNHFLDVLEVHGVSHGHVSDTERDGYDPAGSYALRIRRLSAEFRRQVTGAFARRVGFAHVTCVTRESADVNDDAREATREAMRAAVRLIVGGVVADEERRLCARVPMLMRADVANELFDMHLRAGQGKLSSLYVAVAVKRRPVETVMEGGVRGNCQERAQAEIWLWNEMLAKQQGGDLETALLVGLHPKRTKAIQMGAIPSELEAEMDEAHSRRRKNGRVFDVATWNMGTVRVDGDPSKHRTAALDALEWYVSVVDEGADWICEALSAARKEETSTETVSGIYALAAAAMDNKLRPNMKCASLYDWPWSKVKREIAEQLCELTLVSGVSQSITGAAMKNGIPNDYSNPLVTAKALGTNTELTKNILELCKRDYVGPLVIPAEISHNRNNWRRLQGFNQNLPHRFDKNRPSLPFAEERSFYVDFELASPEYLYSAPPHAEAGDAEKRWQQRFFDTQPSSPLQPEIVTDSLIFMIGCGRILNGVWHHRVFTADSLTIAGESGMIRAWLTYMHAVIPAHNGHPILNVWGPEKQLLRKSLRRMTSTDAAATKEMSFFRMVNVLQVVTQSCVAIKGNLTNSVKTVYSALKGHGLLCDLGLSTRVGGVGTGADAMALGLDAAEWTLQEGGVSLVKAPKMSVIAAYNEADCREIALIAAYLRKHH